MPTVTSSKTCRVYDITSKLYGTSNKVYYLSQGGINLASTDNPSRHPDQYIRKQSSCSIEDAIIMADLRAELLHLTLNQGE